MRPPVGPARGFLRRSTLHTISIPKGDRRTRCSSGGALGACGDRRNLHCSRYDPKSSGGIVPRPTRRAPRHDTILSRISKAHGVPSIGSLNAERAARQPTCDSRAPTPAGPEFVRRHRLSVRRSGRFEPLLAVDGRGAAGAGRGDGLAVVGVDDVARGEDPFDARGRAVVRQPVDQARRGRRRPSRPGRSGSGDSPRGSSRACPGRPPCSASGRWPGRRRRTARRGSSRPWSTGAGRRSGRGSGSSSPRYSATSAFQT